jgi:hypothetical protein
MGLMPRCSYLEIRQNKGATEYDYIDHSDIIGRLNRNDYKSNQDGPDMF